MQLVQIGQEPPAPAAATMTIREMFEQLAQREADFIRAAREKALALHATDKQHTH